MGHGLETSTSTGRPWTGRRIRLDIAPTTIVLLPAFLTAAIVLAITPGPGIAYVVARTVAGGRSEGLASCLGTGLGGLVHVAAAAFGLSILIAHSALAFSAITYVGAAYLVYLGVVTLLRNEPQDAVASVPPSGARRAFLDGIVVEAMNVKTALFFFAFLPQFTSPGSPVAPQMALLGAVCVALNTSVDVAAVLGANRLLSSGAGRSARARLMTRVSGGTMVGLGLLLALARRPT